MQPNDLRRPIEDANRQRRARLIMMLHAAGDAGLEPIPLLALHGMAYLTNALAPVWQVPAFEGAVLKRNGSPYSPQLQWDIDWLVGRRLLNAEHVRHVEEGGKWRVEASFVLNRTLTDDVLEAIRATDFETRFRQFCATVAQAMASLPLDSLTKVLQQDASYGDPAIAAANIVNFGERHGVNYAANAAGAFRPDMKLTPGERVHLYVDHLHARLQRAGHGK